MTSYEMSRTRFMDNYWFMKEYKVRYPEQYKLILILHKQRNKVMKKGIESKETGLLTEADATISLRLRNVLLDNIEKLKADPTYIPQAKNIKDQVQTLINMKQLDLEIMRFEVQCTKLPGVQKLKKSAIKQADETK